jgi:hypothetical protein
MEGHTTLKGLRLIQSSSQERCVMGPSDPLKFSLSAARFYPGP